jgi:hypothetical protein
MKPRREGKLIGVHNDRADLLAWLAAQLQQVTLAHSRAAVKRSRRAKAGAL